MEEAEDRISNLPDSIIHHILSYLPCTRQAIQTGILSKRWYKQWTHVPVLIFDFSDYSEEEVIPSSDTPPLKRAISSSDISKIIQDTLNLHDCSKINNFCLQIQPVTSFWKDSYVLPDFLFNNASLLKFTTVGCTFMPTRSVNWACLAKLLIDTCTLSDQEALKHILSGSPLLESLKLSNVVFRFDKLVVSSKSLKIFPLDLLRFPFKFGSFTELEISCSNLEELSLKSMVMQGCSYSRLDQVIQNVVSNSLFLESLELVECGSYDLVIASKSLRRLVFVDLINCFYIEISCPKLEELELSGCLNVRKAKLTNFPPSLCATIDYYHDYEESIKIQQTFVKDILRQLKDVQQLKIGSWFIKILSAIEVGALFSTGLNIKCLILDYPKSNDYYSGFASLLGNSNMLEKLVIDFSHYKFDYDGLLKSNDFIEDYWDSNAIAFDCLESHLKIVKVISFPNRDKNMVIDFVGFILKNARVLEKLVVIPNHGTSVSSQVSEELLNLPRCSQKAIVVLLNSQ